MILFRLKTAISNMAAAFAHVFGAQSTNRNSFPGLALGMSGETVEQEPFPLLSRWAGKPSKHQQRGGYHAQPANKRKTEMSDTIETQNGDLFATVSFGGVRKVVAEGKAGVNVVALGKVVIKPVAKGADSVNVLLI